MHHILIPETNKEADCARYGVEYFVALDEIQNMIRSYRKHSGRTEQEINTLVNKIFILSTQTLINCPARES